MFMLQLFISLLVLSNVVTQAYGGAILDKIYNATYGPDNSTQTNETRPTDAIYNSSDVDSNLFENATIFNSSVEDKPREAGGPSSLPLYQPANIFSSAGGQNLGASLLVSGPNLGSQGYGGFGAGAGKGQGFGGYGAGMGQGFGAGAGIGQGKGKQLASEFVPPTLGAPYPFYNGMGNIYLGAGGGFFCEGCGGNLVIPPLPPIPPQIYPPTYQWHEFPPLPPFPQIFTPAVAYPTPEAPIMPPPMQQDSSMGQQLLQSPGLGMKGQGMQQQNFPGFGMKGQGMQQQNLPILGHQGQNQQLQGQNLPILGQQGQNQQMQGQNLPILSQQGQGQLMQGQAMQGQSMQGIQ